MNTGDYVQVRIDDLTSSGWGVGRAIDIEGQGDSDRGLVVFVPFTIPGEIVRAKIVEVKKSHLRGEVAEITEPSPERVDPPCPYFGPCPGCSLQHMSYKAQCEAKRNRIGWILGRAIQRETVPKLIPSPHPFGYRTHMAITCEKRGNELAIGLTHPDTRQVVDIPACLLIPEWANRKYSHLRDLLRQSADSLPDHFKMRLFLNYDARDILISAPRGPKVSQRRVPSSLESVLKAFPAPRTVEHQIRGITIRLHPASFIQANYYLTDILYAEAMGSFKPDKNDVAVDLYSGSGYFTLALASEVKKVVAVEADKRATDNLSKSAEDLLKRTKRGKSKHEPDIEIAQGRAEEVADQVLREIRPTLVISNPPRSGMHPAVTEALASSDSVRRVVMVSCDAATCARDIKGLMKGGFEAEEPILIDCYPETAHMEIVVALSR
jgi:23S rRNA (uracil1939-C5)-methyltransferase